MLFFLQRLVLFAGPVDLDDIHPDNAVGSRHGCLDPGFVYVQLALEGDVAPGTAGHRDGAGGPSLGQIVVDDAEALEEQFKG